MSDDDIKLPPLPRPERTAGESIDPPPGTLRLLMEEVDRLTALLKESSNEVSASESKDDKS